MGGQSLINFLASSQADGRESGVSSFQEVETLAVSSHLVCM